MQPSTAAPARAYLLANRREAAPLPPVDATPAGVSAAVRVAVGAGSVRHDPWRTIRMRMSSAGSSLARRSLSTSRTSCPAARTYSGPVLRWQSVPPSATRPRGLVTATEEPLLTVRQFCSASAPGIPRLESPIPQRAKRDLKARGGMISGDSAAWTRPPGA
jgi:hypothetical protein